MSSEFINLDPCEDGECTHCRREGRRWALRFGVHVVRSCHACLGTIRGQIVQLEKRIGRAMS